MKRKPRLRILPVTQKVGAGGTASAQDIATKYVRASRKAVIAAITASGFVPGRTHRCLRENYLLEFMKP